MAAGRRAGTRKTLSQHLPPRQKSNTGTIFGSPKAIFQRPASVPMRDCGQAPVLPVEHTLARAVRQARVGDSGLHHQRAGKSVGPAQPEARRAEGFEGAAQDPGAGNGRGCADRPHAGDRAASCAVVPATDSTRHPLASWSAAGVWRCGCFPGPGMRERSEMASGSEQCAADCSGRLAAHYVVQGGAKGPATPGAPDAAPIK